mgnify:CR=1 FL=1
MVNEGENDDQECGSARNDIGKQTNPRRTKIMRWRLSDGDLGTVTITLFQPIANLVLLYPKFYKKLALLLILLFRGTKIP